jgi:hypothetical protein
MFESHPELQKPQNPDAKIWRYMDLKSFLSLIDTQSLFFRRADLFEDKLEASLPIGQMNAIARSNTLTRNQGTPEEDIQKYNEFRKAELMGIRKNTYLSCWYMENEESIAMWNLYTSKNSGICIQSTYQKLIDALSIATELVWIGTVKYVSYSRMGVEIPEGNILYPFVHKDISFQHEKEIRAIVSDFISVNGGHSYESEPRFNPGRNIDVDLLKLIDKIYVSPDSGKWFKDLMKSVLKKYEFDFQVSESQLIREPYFG